MTDEEDAVSAIRERRDPRADQSIVFTFPESFRLPFVPPTGALVALVDCGHGHLFEAKIYGTSQCPDYCPYCACDSIVDCAGDAVESKRAIQMGGK